MQWRDVIMVIIRSAAMTTPLIQLANFLADLATIVLWIKNRDAIHGQRDGTTQEATSDHRRLFRWHRLQGDAPGVVIKILLRQRHLLLPCRDAHHHVVIRYTIRADVEEVFVSAEIELGKRQEGFGGLRCIRRIRYCCGCELQGGSRGGDLDVRSMPLLQEMSAQYLPVCRIAASFP